MQKKSTQIDKEKRGLVTEQFKGKRRLLTKVAWVAPVITAINLPAHAQATPDTVVAEVTAAPTVPPTTTPGMCTPPDLTPEITATPNQNLQGPTPITITVTAREINGCATDGTEILITIPRISLLSNVTLSPAAGWTSQTTVTLWVFRGSQVIPGNGSVNHTITGTFDAGASNGSQDIVANILNGGGGETPFTNNTAIETVTYIQN